MSRIDEALRRAAEEEAAGEDTKRAATPGVPTGVPPGPRALDAHDVAALAREPYPVEIEAQRRKRARATEVASPPAPAVASIDRRTGEDDRREHEPAHGKTLFERIDARLAEKVVADRNMSPLSREQYRRLAGVLLDAQGNNGTRVVMIASAMPREGKTLTATNVALTLSDSYQRRVLLIDADLRKPALHEVFQLNTAAGLIDGLEAEPDAKLVLRQVSSHLSILPAGRPTSDPMAALTSDRMRHLLEEAKETFDWVIIDTPPLMLLPDAHLLSSLVDGAVLVIRANSTPHEMVKRTGDIIGRNRILGVVLNHADTNGQPGYAGYQGHYYLAAPKDGPIP
jgi:protein-tyrosine kinase